MAPPRSVLALLIGFAFAASGIARAQSIAVTLNYGGSRFIAPATLDDRLEIEGDKLRARRVNTRLLLDVRVDGQGPYRFLVDSGADRSVVGQALAARLTLPPGRAVELNGVAGASRVQTVILDRLALGGGGEALGIQAPALPEASLGADGLIGLDALVGEKMLLDFERRTITLGRAAERATSGETEIVVTARRRKGQLILTQVHGGDTTIHAVIDTGSDITIGNLALEARIFGRGRPPVFTLVTLVSVTGQTVVARLIVMPEMRIGSLVLRHVPIAFTEAPPFALFGLTDQPAILLGTDLLESFRRVGLDFARKRVRFVLRG